MDTILKRIPIPSGIKEIITNGAFILFVVALIGLGSYLFYFNQNETDRDVELFGCFCDILLFGSILTIYDQIKKRKEAIKNYHEQFNDFLEWGEEEGVRRKVGIIRRLNEMGAELPDMYQACLENADLNHANLQGANLINAKLDGAKLQEAILQGADLRANFQGASLFYSNLQGANLEGANLKEADLGRANLEGANLQGANLINAKLDRVKLAGAKLWRANLESAVLIDAVGLVLSQLITVKWNEHTKWPDYIDPEKLKKLKERLKAAEQTIWRQKSPAKPADDDDDSDDKNKP